MGFRSPKKESSKEIHQFHLVSLLNVEDKIFFGVLARRLVNFVVSNEYIDTSVQKADVPGFPGCLEHVAMIWDTIRYVRQEKKDLHVIWLDLANAYGSVQHHLIAKEFDFFLGPQQGEGGDCPILQWFFNAFFYTEIYNQVAGT